MHSKNKKKPSITVELRAGGDPHRSEWPQNRNAYASGFSQGSFAVRFFDLFKVSKITTNFFWLNQSRQNDYFNYELFKDSKMAILIMTCSNQQNDYFDYDSFKVAKWLIIMTCSKFVDLNNYFSVLSFL